MYSGLKVVSESSQAIFKLSKFSVQSIQAQNTCINTVIKKSMLTVAFCKILSESSKLQKKKKKNPGLHHQKNNRSPAEGP